MTFDKEQRRAAARRHAALCNFSRRFSRTFSKKRVNPAADAAGNDNPPRWQGWRQ
jgi:hypothetical protein